MKRQSGPEQLAGYTTTQRIRVSGMTGQSGCTSTEMNQAAKRMADEMRRIEDRLIEGLLYAPGPKGQRDGCRSMGPDPGRPVSDPNVVDLRSDEYHEVVDRKALPSGNDDIKAKVQGWDPTARTQAAP